MRALAARLDRLGGALSDRLSPIFVKEVRQGVRANLFTGTFLAVHAILLVHTLITSTVGASTPATVTFWFFLFLPVLALLQAGSRALTDEHRQKTLELVLLTRMSSHRIVVGKWAALVGQAGAILTAALPYVVARYFVGGIRLGHEALGLLALLLAAALFAALSIGMTPVRAATSPRVGNVAAFVLVWILVGSAPALFGLTGGAPRLPGAGFLLGVVVAAAVVIALMLELAAAQIAPPAENRSSIPRLLALVAIVVGGSPGLVAIVRSLAGATAGRGPGAATHGAGLAFAFVVALPVAAIAASEEIRPIPTLHAPFVKSRRAALLRPFQPGWAGGAWFVLTAIALASVTLLPGAARIEEAAKVLCGLAGVLLVPAAILSSRERWPSKRAAVFVGLLAATGLPIVPILILVAFGYTDAATAVAELSGVFPLTFLLVQIVDSAVTVKGVVLAPWLSLVSSVGAAAFLLVRAERKRRELVRLVLEAPPPPNAAPPPPNASPPGGGASPASAP